MSNTTNLNHAQQLNTQLNAEETHKENYSTEYEKLQGTPFFMIKQEDGWFLAIGNKRITDFQKTKADVINLLHEEKWLIILHMIVHAIEITNFINKNQISLEEYDNSTQPFGK